MAVNNNYQKPDHKSFSKTTFDYEQLLKQLWAKLVENSKDSVICEDCGVKELFLTKSVGGDRGVRKDLRGPER